MVGFNVILPLGTFWLIHPSESYSCQALRVILAPNIQNGIKSIKKTHRTEKCNLSSLRKIRKHLTFYFPGWALLGQIRTNILFQWVFWGSRHGIGNVRDVNPRKAQGGVSIPIPTPKWSLPRQYSSFSFPYFSSSTLGNGDIKNGNGRAEASDTVTGANSDLAFTLSQAL